MDTITLNTSNSHSAPEYRPEESLLSHFHRDAEKKNHFSFMIKSFKTQCNLTKFGTLSVNESTLFI